MIVIVITASRDGRIHTVTLRCVGFGLLKNPMFVFMTLVLFSGLRLASPEPVEKLLTILGAAATPGAPFAINASLAGTSAERPTVANGLTFCKLVLYPRAVSIFAIWVFPFEPFAIIVVISSAALPVAGNVLILAQYYAVAPTRASTAILL